MSYALIHTIRAALKKRHYNHIRTIERRALHFFIRAKIAELRESRLNHRPRFRRLTS